MKGSLLGTLADHLMERSDRETLEQKLNAGGMGWGHAKEALFESFISKFKKPREEYARIAKDPQFIDSVLLAGAEKAKAVATPVLARVRHAVGMR